ncbi:hypothetical protein ACXR0O_25030 [Verrucomicrobiota bacterium sgz303538]
MSLNESSQKYFKLREFEIATDDATLETTAASLLTCRGGSLSRGVSLDAAGVSRALSGVSRDGTAIGREVMELPLA